MLTLTLGLLPPIGGDDIPGGVGDSALPGAPSFDGPDDEPLDIPSPPDDYSGDLVEDVPFGGAVQPVPVPEPGTIFMVGGGVVATIAPALRSRRQPRAIAQSKSSR